MFGVRTRRTTPSPRAKLENKLDPALRQAAMTAAQEGFNVSQNRVADNSTATGELLNSGVPPHETADGAIVWGYTAPHAIYVERGTKPHWVPIEPLLRWARIVLGDEGAAYAVQRKIAVEGTDPQPFVFPGWKRMRQRLRRDGIAKYFGL